MAGLPDDREPPSASAPWTAPDDARELELDLRAYRREQRAARRQARLRRLVGRRNPGVVGAIAIAAVFFGFALVMLSTAAVRTTPRVPPLATPTVPPGRVGGLLPAVPLRVGAERRSARALRPAVLTLLPAACDCLDTVRALAESAGQYGVPLVLIGAGGGEADRLLAQLPRVPAYAAIDVTGALAPAYGAQGVTGVLVRRDGVVTAVERRLDRNRDLADELAQLTA